MLSSGMTSYLFDILSCYFKFVNYFLLLIWENVIMEKLRYLMTEKELVIMYIIKSIIESRVSTKNAAEVLGLNEYQIKHLKASVKKDGEVFIVRKNRSRKPKHTIPAKIRDKIVFLALAKYKSTNYTHLSELLREFIRYYY